MDRDAARAVETALAHRATLAEYARRILRDDHEAEDVAQEVALRAREAPRDAGSLGAWLRAVCYRVAIDRVRSRRRRARIERGLDVREATEGSLVLEEVARASEAAGVRARVGELPEPYRSALRLRYLEGLEFPEIARRLAAKERTARTWVARGLARLREDAGEIGIGWWLAPIVVTAAAFLGLALLSKGDVIPPFICTLF